MNIEEANVLFTSKAAGMLTDSISTNIASVKCIKVSSQKNAL